MAVVGLVQGTELEELMLYENQWERMTTEETTHVPEKMARIAEFQDKSCIETIYRALDGQLYRRRWWFGSSVMKAGEVWFNFLPAALDSTPIKVR